MNNQRYKICLVSISLAGGGAERSCAMLSEMLHQLGHKVHIAILNDDIDYPFAGELFNLGIYKKNNDSLWQRFGRLKRFRRFLVDNSFDVIIDHRTKNNYLKELFYDRYIYKDLKRIYVVHSSNRSLYLTERPERFVKIYNRNCQNVAVSNYIQKEILEKEGVKNCTTIYNTYDDKWEKEITDLPSTLQNKTYILSYGRIVDSVKDFSFLIRSFNRSKVWEQDNYLVIMGDGDDKEILKDITSKLQNN